MWFLMILHRVFKVLGVIGYIWKTVRVRISAEIRLDFSLYPTHNYFEDSRLPEAEPRRKRRETELKFLMYIRCVN